MDGTPLRSRLHQMTVETPTELWNDGCELRSLERTMFDVLADGQPLSSVITASRIPNLDLAPSRIALAKLESKLAGEIDYVPLPKEMIEKNIVK